jgi:subtilase family serine protease
VTTTGLATATAGNTTYYDFSFYSGSGGGISLLAQQPAYQAGIVPDALATTFYYGNGNAVPLPNPMRVAPDIAMDADPYTGYLYGETETIAGSAVLDHGCTPVTATTEYCEEDEGGTSLASPLTAGVMAIVDQARIAAGKPVLGFANPWLYSLKIGTTLDSAGINDVTAPSRPTAVLRGYVSNPAALRVVTINSVPFLPLGGPFGVEVCGSAICEGVDDIFNLTTPGYDDVTGLGTPYVPLLVTE